MFKKGYYRLDFYFTRFLEKISKGISLSIPFTEDRMVETIMLKHIIPQIEKHFAHQHLGSNHIVFWCHKEITQLLIF